MKIPVEGLSNAQRHDIMSTVDNLLPKVLPADWHVHERHPNACWYSTANMRVLLEVELQRGRARTDGFHEIQKWLHLSVSRPNRVPDYDDLINVKSLFIGAERAAIHVFPKRSEHYNCHPHCLHLWSRLDINDWLPDFRTPGGQL